MIAECCLHSHISLSFYTIDHSSTLIFLEGGEGVWLPVMKLREFFRKDLEARSSQGSTWLLVLFH